MAEAQQIPDGDLNGINLMRPTHKTIAANSLRRFQKRALFIVNDAFTKVLCLHPLPGIIHVNRIEKEMILLSRHQLVEIHEQEPIMVRGDGSQHFVELIDTFALN